MADHVKDHENKDEESGRPVQLDHEPQPDQQDKDKHGMDKDKQGMEHDRKPGQPHGGDR